MASNADRFGTGSDLARSIGIDESMVRRYRDRGLFAGAMTGPERTPYDLARCKSLYEINRDPDAALKGVAGGDAVGMAAGRLPDNALSRARTAKAILEGQAHKLKIDRMTGKLIAKADAQAAVRAAITVITERLDGAAAQIGPRVAGNPSAADCERIARDILRGIRAEIAGMADALEAVGAPDAA